VSAPVDLVRLRPLTVGYETTSEHEGWYGLCNMKSEHRLRQRKRAEAEAARRREPEAPPPSYFARARRTCAEGATAAFHLVFGKDALEEDISFTDRRRQILRDRKRPTVSELREARLHDVDMKLETQPEEIVEDGPLTEIADWFGQDWWFWNEDAEERAHKIDPARSTEEAMRRRRDPLIVKLRFRQYEEHTDAAT